MTFQRLEEFVDSFIDNAFFNLVDKGDHYLLNVDLPGLSKEDVTLTVDDNLLHVEGTKVQADGEREIRRTYSVPYDVDNVEAFMENGSLSVYLHRQSNNSRQIEIQ